MSIFPLIHTEPQRVFFLDIQTLYFSVAVVATFFSIAFLSFHFVDTRAKGTTQWGIGYVLIAIGLFTGVFRPSIYIINKTISALAFLFATIFLNRGISSTTNNERFLIGDIALLLVFLFAITVELSFIRDPRIANDIHMGALAIGVLRIAIHLAVHSKNTSGQIRLAFMVSAIITGLSAMVLISLIYFISLMDPHQGPFESHPIHTLLIPTLMISLIGAGMSKFWGHYVRIYKEAYNASTYDALTGLRNRYYMSPELERNFIKAQREKLNLSCIMIDVDHFKKINDEYGHLTGDKVLKELATRIKETVRNYDNVGRFGGEEFLVYEFSASAESVISIARRIHDSVRSDPIAGIHITVSIGVASISSNDKSIDSIIHRSDEALYKAKRNGRDRIEIAAEFTDYI